MGYKLFYSFPNHHRLERGDLIEVKGKTGVILNVKLSGIVVGIGWSYRTIRLLKKSIKWILK